MNIDQIYSNQSDYIQQLLQVSENGEVYGQYKGYTFHSVFQPILDQAGNIFGLEGLSRIKSPKGDSVNPYQFFTSSEQELEKNIICSLLCGKVQTANFAMSVYRDRHLFINVSPSVFRMLANNEEAIKRFISRLQYLNLSKSQIIYEIIEFAEPDMSSILKGKSTLAKYKIHTALDDYGAMHSTIERALTIRAPYLKIDKDKMNDDRFVKEAVALARIINAKTIAEGIESKQEYEQCKALGVDLFQGYYLAKPASVFNFDSKRLSSVQR